MYDKLVGAVPSDVIDELFVVVADKSINTPFRLAHFLSQCAHESLDFTVREENLNYSAEGLMRVFPKYFANCAVEEYARNPQKIASRVYGGRMGNGDEATGEGYTYRGRGYIQLTGKDNYISFGKTVSYDIIANPELVADKFPLLSAAWFWSSKGLNRVADKGAGKAVVAEVTRIVNGGLHGLEDREAKFNKFIKFLEK